jgi:hypothetical protein
MITPLIPSPQEGETGGLGFLRPGPNFWAKLGRPYLRNKKKKELGVWLKW